MQSLLHVTKCHINASEKCCGALPLARVIFFSSHDAVTQHVNMTKQKCDGPVHWLSHTSKIHQKPGLLDSCV